ncbi:MAG: carbamoyltransferase HypF, partial [Bacteroidota bacterium]
ADLSDVVTEISPDIAVCDECLQDMEIQPNRIHYPFVNCTNCGPRFSIIQDLPYDREKTTMSDFNMCDQCQREYTDKTDRRFHAQPVACNDCGPQYTLHLNGFRIEGTTGKLMDTLASAINKGKIVAIKGIGGFHLACNAFNEAAVKKLRKRKHREGKPFAVIFRDIESIRKVALVSKEEKEALTSWRRPIVLLGLKTNHGFPSSVNSALSTIGAFLPYMPLHHLLFRELKTAALVLTSGNLSDEPIITDNEDALQRLSGIADGILTYNREIHHRVDDSVVRIINRKERILRRSRGYVPMPVRLDFDVEGIVALGAELVNCFCIGKGKNAILSQFIGDLKEYRTNQFYEETLDQFMHLFRVKPALVVCDMHPEYFSTKTAKRFKCPILSVQHHHAHIASCMAEHGLDEKVIGVAFDGTGYGTDGNTWGAEFMVCDLLDFTRISHFAYLPLPGGDKAVEEPWRMAVSYLYHAFGKDFLKMELPFLKSAGQNKIRLIVEMLEKKINSPLISSAGRAFDAISAMLNLCLYSHYEAEAPMVLESKINGSCVDKYTFATEAILSPTKMIREVVGDLLGNVDISVISAKFHNTIISIIFEMVNQISEKEKISKVILSGGVFQNKYILENIEPMLIKKGFRVYTHSKIPPNDGGIALGQLVIAAKRRQMKCV